MVLSLSACGKTLKGTDGLIEKAREEIPISDSDTIDLQYAGMCGNDNRAIAWFISGNEYQKNYYLPMEVEVKEDAAEYTFIRTYKPIDDRIGDIAYIQWGDGYAFIVNNTNCKSVRFTSGNEVYEEVIPDDTYPYVFFYLSDHTNSTLQGAVKIYAQNCLQAPADLKSAGNRGVVQSRLQVLHIHVFLAAPLRPCHVA